MQGSSGEEQASAAEFFDNALAWFGHDGSPIRSEHDRGVKLAELVRRQRTLLLDGLEPLQHPLGGPMNGALKDKGLVSLCVQLAADGNGLLLISSRQPVMELNNIRPEQPQNLDTHPLVRQYFGKRLSELHPESWRQAHVRLYEHFKAAAKELPDTLEEMEPLFAAVRHGCAAGMHQQALEEVYWPRIKRQDEHYLTKKLGAFAADLAVLAHFFAVPWSMPAAELTDAAKAAVLNWAAFRLRALGRLSEAVEPMQAAMEMRIQQEAWQNAAINATSLSELYLTSGDIVQAVAAGRQSVELADRSGDAFQRMGNRTTLADALHQAGELAESHALFAEAEKMQQEWQSQYDRLYSLQGFRYCDLLLAGGAWPEVRGRAEKTLQWVTKAHWLLDIALDKLSLGRAAVQEAIAQAGLPVISGLAPDLACVQPISRYVEPIRRGDERIDGAVERIVGYDEPIRRAVEWLNQAVDGLREAGTEHHLPRGLLARAACSRWAAQFPAAERDLQECEEIAQRGGMQLYLIDCHLEAARLARASGRAVLGHTAEEHLAAAQDGIAKIGYKRRLVEAEQVAEVFSKQGKYSPLAA